MKKLNPNNNSNLEKLLTLLSNQGIDLNSKINIYPEAEKNILSAIKKEFTKKPGIYCWVNKINGKSYVGSSKSNLYKRIAKYYYLSSFGGKSKIFAALANYDPKNFILIILEVMPLDVLPSKVLAREKYWINITDSEYNILKEPDLGSLGFKQTSQSKEKMRDAANKRKQEPNFNERMRALAGHKNQMIIVYVYSYPDLTLLKTYPGLRVAAKEENFAASTISDHIKSGKPLKKLGKLLIFSNKLLTK